MLYKVGDINLLAFPDYRGVEALKEHVKANTGRVLANIVDHESATMTGAIQITLASGLQFSMGQIPSQCGWVVAGEYLNVKNGDFFDIVRISQLFAELSRYGGLYVNAYYVSEEGVLEDFGFERVFRNDLGSLFYKETGIEMDPDFEERDYDDFWEDYDGDYDEDY